MDYSEETSLSIQENTEDISLKPNPLSPFSLPESANLNSHAEDISYAASLKPILTVFVNENFSYIPEKPKLSTTNLDSVSIPPSMPKLSNLSVHSVQQTSIPPKQVFHPAIIRATLSMFGKKPDCLSAEEVDKFNSYMDWKIQCGERLEDDILYNPSEVTLVLTITESLSRYPTKIQFWVSANKLSLKISKDGNKNGCMK